MSQELTGHADIGVGRFAVVLNKSVNVDDDLAWISAEFASGQVLGALPFDPRIAAADRGGRSLLDSANDDLLAPFRNIQRILAAQYEDVSDLPAQRPNY